MLLQCNQGPTGSLTTAHCSWLGHFVQVDIKRDKRMGRWRYERLPEHASRMRLLMGPISSGRMGVAQKCVNGP